LFLPGGREYVLGVYGAIAVEGVVLEVELGEVVLVTLEVVVSGLSLFLLFLSNVPLLSRFIRWLVRHRLVQ
jgi:hypothetical protein